MAVAAPLLWLAWDWIVTGRPLYSLTSTRETAGEFKRDRGVVEALKLVPDYVGANEKIVNVAIGGVGSPTARWMLKRPALMPEALIAIGRVQFPPVATPRLSAFPHHLAV